MPDASVGFETGGHVAVDKSVLVLCHAADSLAAWLARHLADLLPGRVELLTIDELVYARSIVHRFGTTVDSSVFRLFDGREIHSDGVSGIVNRLQVPPDQHLDRVAAADRLYAAQELQAFLLGWLTSLSARVVNPPLPNALSGFAADMALQHHWAATAGLPCRPFLAGSDFTNCDPDAGLGPVFSLLIFDDTVYGPIVPVSLRAAARRFARLAGLSLIQVDFVQCSVCDYCFHSARGLVDPRIGGRPFVRQLALALSEAKVSA